MSEISERHWHLDKRVNVSIIMALIAQAALGLTWANQLSFEVAELKKDVAALALRSSQREEALREVVAIKGLVEALKLNQSALNSRMDVVIELKTQMKDVVDEIKETRREYRASNARLWDETRNLRNAIANRSRAPSPVTRSPDEVNGSYEPPIPARRPR